jgi:ATP-binding cassette subfamily B protein
MGFKYYKQSNAMDCGPTCLRMVAKHYGKHYNADSLRQIAGYNKQGVSILGISKTAEQIGFRTRALQINYKTLENVPLPAILHWNQNHFVVLISINKKKIKIADPDAGVIAYTKQEFLEHWESIQLQENERSGIVLLLEPSTAFYENSGQNENKLNWGTITQYLRPNKGRLTQVVVSLIMSSALQLIFPFLTQSIVDTGINTRNLQFITLILIAQLMLTISTTVVGFIRMRLQLKISNSINISILSDFLIKLTRLPIAYFDAHQAGDTMQRLDDNRQIQSFITGTALGTVFSIFNFFIYSIILLSYSGALFVIFTIGNLAYLLWITLFLRIRRKINYETFHISAKENNATLQLVQGMQEIRLNNAEQLKRWEWENIQAGIFKLNLKSLTYGQWQGAGAVFINQGKDIILSFFVARLVIQGQLTFGAMLAIQYIVGQLSGPVQEFIELSQNIQNAKISMERLNEVHSLKDEEPIDSVMVSTLPDNKSIVFNDVAFAYPGAGNQPVLDKIQLTLEEGKVNAIVGGSGSGKTTLLKLLLKIHENYDGEIKVGDMNFKYLSPSYWREQCGAVLQDGYIFNDSIARNIVIGDEYIDRDKLVQSCRIAHILQFIETLPNGFNTKLGSEGVGISQGQKQRLLIARAVYKNPQYLFFDEATNALDANNEKAIVESLGQFFNGKTVVVVAHRLSTVKHADKIIVLNKGAIAEEGTHQELTALKGLYYSLVKNQLELGY